MQFSDINYSIHTLVGFYTKVYYKTKYIWSDDIDKPWKECVLFVKGDEDDARRLIFGWNDYRHITLKLPRGRGHHYIFIKSEQV